MRAGQDYYSLLGVPRDVTPEELKRAYRQLVRQHHPDVAIDAEAATERFVAIVEAYRTISDPARRRAYDALRAGTESAPITQETQVLRQIDDWFRHAVHRIEQGDLGGAAAQGRKILALDPNHAAAHALLGDVCARRAEWDQALVHYSGAVAAAPRNPVYARKLRDAAGAGQEARAAEERRQTAAQRRQRAREALILRHSLTPYTAIVMVTWAAALLLWAWRAESRPVPSWFPLTFPLTVAALGGGALSGVLLGLIDWDHDELPGWLVAVLGVLAVGSYFVSAAGFCVVAAVRGRASLPLAAAYLLSAGLVLLITAAAGLSPSGGDGAAVPAVLWSGNLVLPALLVGRAVGRGGLREPA